MNTLTKTLLSIGAVLLAGAVGIMIYCFWPSVKGTIDESKYYSAEEAQEFYDKGYNDGCKSETELIGQVDYYKGIVDEYYIQVNTLNDEITMLINTNRDYETHVSNLETQKTSLLEQVENLTTIKSNNDTTISSLNTQIIQLQKEVADLENSSNDKDETITQKNTQITSLQSTVLQLQKTNELNIETITNLNNQIASLNTQISDMTLQIQNNSTNVTALNNKIAELEKSVAYYEQYIANLENGEQVVATFEFNGSVYNIQIVNKNSTVSVVNPISTDYVIFNYWTVNGEQIDLSNYQITSNVKIVANVTHKYDVKFMVDATEHNTQIVIKNGYATIPANPIKTGYEFDGWTINGVDIVNPNIVAITQNTTYIAKFTKLHTVTFMYEDEIYTTQTVRNNEYSSNVSVVNTDYKVFNGWKLNDVIIDVNTQKIVADTVFVADIVYKYDVKFMVDETEYNTQIVIKNGYATIPANPTKTGYEFDGWTINGVDIVNPNIVAITQNTTYIAKFTKLHTVTFIYENTTYTTQSVRNNECSSYVKVNSTTYKVFNGWKLNDVIIDVNTYKIVADTVFVADIIYKYDVKFIVDGVEYNNQIITKNSCSLIPVTPTKKDYNFIGWSIDGTNIVNVSTYAITENTNFVAIFELALTKNGTFIGEVYNGDSYMYSFEFVVQDNNLKSVTVTQQPPISISMSVSSSSNFEICMQTGNTKLGFNYDEANSIWYFAGAEMNFGTYRFTINVSRK